ncbi:hypothetical protein B0H17DRAFT_1284891 [Mycena rosella]|uniref:Uncharacterized protein n=1 Tax=Mycena rosella TaxID=1033263 RepID=A0AAD7BTL8_MYCRO|nr:hypothetical protein B0H17DRAFT_1284891 [Mycena rosella]
MVGLGMHAGKAAPPLSEGRDIVMRNRDAGSVQTSGRAELAAVARMSIDAGVQMKQHAQQNKVWLQASRLLRWNCRVIEASIDPSGICNDTVLLVERRIQRIQLSRWKYSCQEIIIICRLRLVREDIHGEDRFGIQDFKGEGVDALAKHIAASMNNAQVSKGNNGGLDGGAEPWRASWDKSAAAARSRSQWSRLEKRLRAMERGQSKTKTTPRQSHTDDSEGREKARARDGWTVGYGVVEYTVISRHLSCVSPWAELNPYSPARQDNVFGVGGGGGAYKYDCNE